MLESPWSGLKIRIMCYGFVISIGFIITCISSCWCYSSIIVTFRYVSSYCYYYYTTDDSCAYWCIDCYYDCSVIASTLEGLAGAPG